MSADFLLYGATGYTGKLVARDAVQLGMRPILAGRDATKLAKLTAEFGLEHRAFALDDAAELDRALGAVPLVLHCAGPFIDTAAPMIEACLRTGTHYLDVTGEIPVFEALAGRDAEARERGVLVLPGMGFGIVPTDCLAAHLKRRLPSATRLVLGWRATGARGARPRLLVSRGTARTILSALPRGAMLRRDGQLVAVPHGAKSREIDFGRGPVRAVLVAWGDVSTAYYSTGIPNIEEYSVVPRPIALLFRASRVATPLLRAPRVRRAAEWLIEKRAPGPTAAERERSRSLVWGEVVDDAGGRAAARLQAPNGYSLTSAASLLAISKLLGGAAPVGFQTPSLAFGADFVLEIDGVVRSDLA